MKIKFSKTAAKTADTIVLVEHEGKTRSEHFKALDTQAGGALSAALKAQEFEGKSGQSVTLITPANVATSRVVIVGAGKKKDMTPVCWEKLGGRVFDLLKASKSKKVALHTPDGDDAAAAAIASGIGLKSYEFTVLKTLNKEPQKLEAVDLVAADPVAAQKEYDDYKAVQDGVFLARDLVTLPPNLLYPESYADEIKKAFAKTKVEVTVIDHKTAKKLGMGALLCVGQGSDNPPCIVIMHYKGGKGDETPLALVGKGITFDTGGISLKPGAGMWDMKWDMGGSAAVVGAMKALLNRKAKANVVGIVALAENMPSGKATRPSDVVKSYSGKTIEVLNTDAEGRLVLADALSYVQEKFKPKTVIDLATLTGAIIVGLGHEYAGLFANNDALVKKLDASGKETDEQLWHMPIADAFEKAVVSDVADLKNITDSSVGAGSCTAAAFLKQFIDKDVDWAHLDIAGTAWAYKPNDLCPKGGSGFGVRLLNRFIKKNYG